MHSGHHETVGTVVASLQRNIVVGRAATISRDAAAVTVVQDGRVRAEWDSASATVAYRHSAVEQRYTPLWAILLGLITLPMFGIGLVFFFVRQTRRAPCTRVTVLVGRLPMVSVAQVATPALLVDPGHRGLLVAPAA